MRGSLPPGVPSGTHPPPMADVLRHAAVAEPMFMGPVGRRKLRRGISSKGPYEGCFVVGREPKAAGLPQDPVPLQISGRKLQLGPAGSDLENVLPSLGLPEPAGP